MKIKERKKVYDGFFQIKKLTLQDEKGQYIEREQFERGNSVAALVFDTHKEKYILTEQYRVGAEQPLLEIVAGSLDEPNESPEATIRREIQEEIGYTVDDLQYLTKFYPSPGACTEIIYLYYAEVSNKNTEGGGIGDEHIEPVTLTPRQFLRTTFNDGKTMVSQYWLQSQYNQQVE